MVQSPICCLFLSLPFRFRGGVACGPFLTGALFDRYPVLLPLGEQPSLAKRFLLSHTARISAPQHCNSLHLELLRCAPHTSPVPIFRPRVATLHLLLYTVCFLLVHLSALRSCWHSACMNSLQPTVHLCFQTSLSIGEDRVTPSPTCHFAPLDVRFLSNAVTDLQLIMALSLLCFSVNSHVLL
jgi:hypothetical protein